MIRVFSKELNDWIKIDSVINRGDTNSNAFHLIGFGFGYSTITVLVRGAGSAQEALDIYADSNKAGMTRIKNDEMDDYLQDGRETFISCLKDMAQLIQETFILAKTGCDYLADNAKVDLNMLQVKLTKLKHYMENEDYDWDSNGPHDMNRVTYLGNYGDPHDISDIRLLECIPRKNVEWFAKEEP